MVIVIFFAFIYLFFCLSNLFLFMFYFLNSIHTNSLRLRDSTKISSLPPTIQITYYNKVMYSIDNKK